MNDDNRLDDMLHRWEQGIEEGRDMRADELCHDCPELIPTVQAGIESLKRLAWLKQVEQEINKPFDLNINTSQTPFLEAVPSADVPQVVGERYRLDTLIGEGGFGQVWRSYDLELHRLVAVKVPKQSRLGNEEEQGFLAEARKVARLNHPAIVPVYDVGRFKTSWFIVSQLIDGIDLGERMRQGRLPVRESMGIVETVANALDYAHSMGIIHQDIKPANILLGKNGQVYLTDFGIAFDRQAATDGERDVFGTLAYMSPEQMSGNRQGVDRRSDIYSLGVLLCELVTRVCPPSAINTVKIRRPEYAISVSPGLTVPGFLTEVWRKCTAKEPAGRYATATEVADYLRRAVTVVLEDDEWATCTDPLLMLRQVHESAPQRKMRLLLCAYVRQNFPVLDDERSRLALEVAERHADGRATHEELAFARGTAWTAREEAWDVRHDRQGMHQALNASWATMPNVWTAVFNMAKHTDSEAQCRLLREFFGPSAYRPLSPTLPSWNNETVRSIAQGVYNERAFDRLPMLGEALQNAGCQDSDILQHCWEPGPHYPGCWVIDQILENN